MMIETQTRSMGTRPTQERTKVLYIGGYLRIGSTILDRLLGECEGFVSVGELRRVWEENFAEDQPCGCGAPFSTCSFWRAVIKGAYGGFDEANLGEIIRLKSRVDRMRYIPQLMSPWRLPRYRKALAKYSDVVTRLYTGIQEVSGERVIIDSSKDPSYAYLLANLPDIDLYVVHLVRDSRAVSYSWLRTKIKHEVGNGSKKVYMPQRGPIDSSVGWTRANLLIEPLRYCGVNYMRVRYEDLLAAPQSVLLDILAVLREEQSLPFLDGHSAKLGLAHTVAGNPMRFRHGVIELCLDEEWKRAMRPVDRRVVTAMTLPLLSRYGYLRRSDGITVSEEDRKR
jgi:hypothetical protein